LILAPNEGPSKKLKALVSDLLPTSASNLASIQLLLFGYPAARATPTILATLPCRQLPADDRAPFFARSLSLSLVLRQNRQVLRYSSPLAPL
jgi:hypothetical protein